MAKVFILLIMQILLSGILAASELPLSDIILPEGFNIEVYALGLDQVRGLDFAENGILYAGSKSGTVYAVLENREIVPIDRGIDWPVSVDFYQNDLYVSSHRSVYVYRNINSRIRNAEREIYFSGFPTNRQNGWRYIRFGNDGFLYASIGMPCNVCEKRSPFFGSIMRISPGGSHTEVYVDGIRFSVGFDWDREGNLWFTDNGRDDLGDTVPPDELNKVSEKGQFFGFPYIHGKGIREAQYRQKSLSIVSTPPEIELPAHVAPLGIAFYYKHSFPLKYHSGIFIAEHGSTNTSEITGYRISYITIKNGRAVAYEVFARGWIRQKELWGRLADITVGPDDALYVSDDRAHAVYRIYFTGSRRREL